MSGRLGMDDGVRDDDDFGPALHSVSCRDQDCPTWHGVGECMDIGDYEDGRDD